MRDTIIIVTVTVTMPGNWGITFPVLKIQYIATTWQQAISVFPIRVL